MLCVSHDHSLVCADTVHLVLETRESLDWSAMSCCSYVGISFVFSLSNNNKKERIKGTEKASPIHTLFHS